MQAGLFGFGLVQRGDLLVPHPIGRGATPGGQSDPASPLQFEEQGPGRHVFELAGGSSPTPHPGQFPADPPAAPTGLRRQKPLHFRQFFGPDPATLNDLGFVRRPSTCQTQSAESRKK